MVEIHPIDNVNPVIGQVGVALMSLSLRRKLKLTLAVVPEDGTE